MKKIYLIFMTLITTTALWAYDFQSGDLYYNITSNTTVEVTYQHFYSVDNYAEFTELAIPQQLIYNGIVYTVTSIGEMAFSRCQNLSSITIPNSITQIGGSAFYDCSSLSSVIIPSSVVQIGNHAFENCYSLTSLVIPNSVTSIDNFAFCNCIALNSLSISEKLVYLGDWAFCGCSSLTNVVLPETLTFIAWGVFEGCTSLESIVVPKDISVIGFSAFCGCKSLRSITIPQKVSQVGDWAFSKCPSLETVYCYAPTPPLLDLESFEIDRAILFVPCDLVETYQSDVSWSTFFNTIQCIGDEDIETSIENTHTPSPIINSPKLIHNGQLIILRDGKTYNVMGQEL